VIPWQTVWYYVSQFILILFSLIELLLAAKLDMPNWLISLVLGVVLAVIAYFKYRRRRRRYETDFEQEY
jgi:membrane protein implicated in regulation of membrane protease activity